MTLVDGQEISLNILARTPEGAIAIARRLLQIGGKLWELKATLGN